MIPSWIPEGSPAWRKAQADPAYAAWLLGVAEDRPPPAPLRVARTAKEGPRKGCCGGDKAARLTVPQPPALDLSPRSDLAVVTCVVGAEARACFATSERYHRAYAERVGADLVTLDWPGHPDWPLSAKFAASKVLDYYERIAFIDADILLRPEAVNLFEACGPGEVGFVDELPFQRLIPGFGVERDYRQFREQVGLGDPGPLPWALNSGVMVVPVFAQWVLEAPRVPVPPGHLSEQHWRWARVADSLVPYRLLDRRCNWQSWTDPGFAAAPGDAILHWSGAGRDRAKRAESMREWAGKYPL